MRERLDAWGELKTLGVDVVGYLATGYSKMKKAPGRTTCVFYSMSYSRTSEEAYELGVVALNDKATTVRYRACGLLAYSLRKDAIPYLRSLLQHRDSRTVADARAAIDAIENENHHLFVDRRHSGRMFWDLNPGDVKR